MTSSPVDRTREHLELLADALTLPSEWEYRAATDDGGFTAVCLSSESATLAARAMPWWANRWHIERRRKAGVWEALPDDSERTP